MPCARCDNLFRDLDSRPLTADEEDIIAQRLALQRRMLAEYEAREGARKARRLGSLLCTDLCLRMVNHMHKGTICVPACCCTTASL